MVHWIQLSSCGAYGPPPNNNVQIKRVITESSNTNPINEYEKIDIYNVTNGERFTTYTILAQPGSGIISVNGAAAHKASPGDKLVICSYIDVPSDQIKKHKPTLVYLDSNNKIIKKTASIAMQLV